LMFSRGLVNLWYGSQKRLKSMSIGQVWRPAGSPPPGVELSTEEPAAKT
jgi:preprotein translocase subunit SecD